MRFVLIALVLASSAAAQNVADVWDGRSEPSVRGVLDAGDPQVGLGSPSDTFSVVVTVPSYLVVTMASEAFEPSVGVVAPDGTTWRDPWSRGFPDSRIELLAPDAGVYTVLASASWTDGRGAYVFRVSTTPVTMRLDEAGRLADGDDTWSETLTDGGDEFLQGGYADTWALTAPAGQRLYVEVESQGDPAPPVALEAVSEQGERRADALYANRVVRLGPLAGGAAWTVSVLSTSRGAAVAYRIRAFTVGAD